MVHSVECLPEVDEQGTDRAFLINSLAPSVTDGNLAMHASDRRT